MEEVQPTEGRSAEPEGQGLIKGGMKEHLSSLYAKCLVVQVIAGITLIIAITVKQNTQSVSNDNWEYTVAAGAVGAFFAFVGLAMVAKSKGDYLLFSAPILGPINVTCFNALFLFVWWGIAVVVITFNAPFTVTGNGYFATWVGTIGALMGLATVLPSLKDAARARFNNMVALGVCAAVLGFETAMINLIPATGVTIATTQVAFGITVAVVTFMFVMINVLLDLYGTPLDANIQRAVLITIILVWGAAAAWLTLTSPFTGTGNGYFALWLGLFVASRLVVDVAGYFKSAISNESLAAMWGQFVAGCVVMLAITALPNESSPGVPATENWGYTLAVGIVAAVFSFGGALLLRNQSGTKPLFTLRGHAVTLERLLAIFLFLWWAVGTGVLTIDGPFDSTSTAANGYFACWIGVLCSLSGLGVSMETVKTRIASGASSGMTTQIVLAICSIMLFLDVLPYVSADDPATADYQRYQQYEAPIIYIIIVACVTVVRVLLSILLLKKGKTLGKLLEKVLATTRFVKWAILAGWVTFHGPFGPSAGTGNGYFAAWGGAVCAVILALGIFLPTPPGAALSDSSELPSSSGEEGLVAATVSHDSLAPTYGSGPESPVVVVEKPTDE